MSKIAPELKVVRLSSSGTPELAYPDGTRKIVRQNQYFRGALDRGILHLQQDGWTVVGWIKERSHFKIYVL